MGGSLEIVILVCKFQSRREILNFFNLCQGALKGTNLRGQTEPKRRFSLILADFR